MMGNLETCPFIWPQSGKILSKETFQQRLPFKGAERASPWSRHHLSLGEDSRVPMCQSGEFLDESPGHLGSALGDREVHSPWLSWTHLRG